MRMLLLLAILLLACRSPFGPADAAEIHGLMAAQVAAWDRGDLPGFMEAYSDTVCFTGSGGTTCGREAVLANYRKSYPDRERMGRLHFGISEVVPAGGAHAWVTGSWALHRTADTLSGGFTLLWVREEGGWRIARDHSY